MCSCKSADFLEKNNQEIVMPAFSLERGRGEKVTFLKQPKSYLSFLLVSVEERRLTVNIMVNEEINQWLSDSDKEKDSIFM